MTLPGFTEYRDATLSADGNYRYDLVRRWDHHEHGTDVLWVMLNPSTADAWQDDPTIRRCRGFSQREGADGLVVVNICALRATHPADLDRAADPVGPDNEATLRRWFASSAVSSVVCAWGAFPIGRPRIEEAAAAVTRIALDSGRRLACLGHTKAGAPRHPLYVPASQPLEVYP